MHISASNAKQQVINTGVAKSEKGDGKSFSGSIEKTQSQLNSPSIQSLNTTIRYHEQFGEDYQGQLDDLREQRDDAIAKYTGATDISAYDRQIVAQAQDNGMSYNAMVDAWNSMAELSDEPRPDTEQSPTKLKKLDRVENLPWEMPAVNDRVDELISQEGLSLDAAVVIAMTERQSPQAMVNSEGHLPCSARENTPSMQGDWQAGFADRVVRSAAEIAGWAEALNDPAGITTVMLNSAGENVTIAQRADGMLVVRSDKPTVPDREIDPNGKDRIFILGSDGDDQITIDPSVTANMVVAGGNGDDQIFGGGGNDVLIGGNGSDLIYGNGGTDIIIGGEGADRIDAGEGGDIVLGGAGADAILGGNGNDILLGGKGRDFLYGGHGDDMLFSQSGNSVVFGSTGNDFVQGNNNDEALFAATNRKALHMSSGNDDLDSGATTKRIHFIDPDHPRVHNGNDEISIDLKKEKYEITNRDTLRANSGTDDLDIRARTKRIHFIDPDHPRVNNGNDEIDIDLKKEKYEITNRDTLRANSGNDEIGAEAGCSQVVPPVLALFHALTQVFDHTDNSYRQEDNADRFRILQA